MTVVLNGLLFFRKNLGFCQVGRAALVLRRVFVFRKNLGFYQVGNLPGGNFSRKPGVLSGWGPGFQDVCCSARAPWVCEADLLTILSGGPVTAGLEGGFVTPGAGLLNRCLA
jgi:hypothetical protein